MAATNQEPRITSNQFDELKQVYESGARLCDMADHFGVSISSVRRALVRVKLPPVTVRDAGKKSAKAPLSAGQLSRYRDEWKVRITDAPETLTAAICGDPTPMRRELMRSGRI